MSNAAPPLTSRVARAPGVVLLLFVLAGCAAGGTVVYGAAGAADFIQYWSAFKLAALGNNPYDAALMLEVQRPHGMTESFPIMMWNPPWLLLLMAPFVAGSFSGSVTAWLAANVLFILITLVSVIAVIKKIFGVSLNRRATIWMIAGAFLFFPAIDNIHSGQLGLLLTAACAAALWAMAAMHYVVAGLLLAVLTVKPHLFLLVFVGIAVWTARHREYRLPAGLIGGTLILIAATRVIFPGVLSAWWSVLLDPPPSSVVPGILEWRSDTFVGWMRWMFLSLTAVRHDWLMAAVPISAMVIGGLVLWRAGTGVVWRVMPAMLCFSLLAAPYGWLSDYSVMLVPHLMILGIVLAGKNQRRGGVIAAILVTAQFVLYAASILSKETHLYIFLLPVLLVSVWYAVMPRAVGEAVP